jgi:hypothetical protein
MWTLALGMARRRDGAELRGMDQAVALHRDILVRMSIQDNISLHVFIKTQELLKLYWAQSFVTRSFAAMQQILASERRRRLLTWTPGIDAES